MWISIDEVTTNGVAQIVMEGNNCALLACGEKLYAIRMDEYEPQASGFTRYTIDLAFLDDGWAKDAPVTEVDVN